MTENTNYTYMARRFNESMGVDEDGVADADEIRAQQNVIEEEYGEYCDAFSRYDRGDIAEEMADVLVTIFVQADRLDIDIGEAYKRKMTYNLKKSGRRDDSGKVKDDVNIEKPDFSDLV